MAQLTCYVLANFILVMPATDTRHSSRSASSARLGDIYEEPGCVSKGSPGLTAPAAINRRRPLPSVLPPTWEGRTLAATRRLPAPPPLLVSYYITVYRSH